MVRCHIVGPHGNLANIDPQEVADICDKRGIPWYTEGWPYSSGIKVYCDNDCWIEILKTLKTDISLHKLLNEKRKEENNFGKDY